MNYDIAFKSREEIDAFQLNLLTEQLEYVSEHSPF